MTRRCVCFSVALLVAGCSGGSSSSSVSNAVTEASAAPVTTASAAPTAAGDTSATNSVATNTVAAPAAPAGSQAPSSAPAPSATPQFTDLAGVYGADKIQQLAQLHAFDGIDGEAFGANQPVMRREFVRWLYAANNAIQSDDAKKIRPAPPGETAYFKDLPASDKDFVAIQGLQDAGISVGFPDKTFQADIPITREQALAVALGVDCNYDGNWSKTPNQAYVYLPPWKDKDSISKTYAPIIATCAMQGPTPEIVGRVWGKTAVFRPQAKLTRSEAALMIYKTGSRDASDALGATPTPSP